MLCYSDTFLVPLAPKSDDDFFLLGVIDNLNFGIELTDTKEATAYTGVRKQIGPVSKEGLMSI